MIFSALINKYSKKQKGENRLWNPLEHIEANRKDEFIFYKRYADEVTLDGKILNDYLDNREILWLNQLTR
jgi:hypothetical protein